MKVRTDHQSYTLSMVSALLLLGPHTNTTKLSTTQKIDTPPTYTRPQLLLKRARALSNELLPTLRPAPTPNSPHRRLLRHLHRNLPRPRLSTPLDPRHQLLEHQLSLILRHGRHKAVTAAGGPASSAASRCA